MPARLHSWEQDAQDIAAWLDDESKKLADSLMENNHAPFAAPVSKQDRLGFFDRQLYLADGTPNQQGRAAVMEHAGVDGYVAAKREVDAMRAGVLAAHGVTGDPTTQGATVMGPLPGQ